MGINKINDIQIFGIIYCKFENNSICIENKLLDEATLDIFYPILI